MQGKGVLFLGAGGWDMSGCESGLKDEHTTWKKCKLAASSYDLVLKSCWVLPPSSVVGEHILITELEGEKPCSFTLFLTRNFFDKHCGLRPENVELCLGCDPKAFWGTQCTGSSDGYMCAQIHAFLVNSELEVPSTSARPSSDHRKCIWKKKRVGKYCTWLLAWVSASYISLLL